MRVTFFEELVASLKNLLNIIIVLLVEAKSAIDDSRTFDDTVSLETYTLETKVLGISFKVV